MPLSLTAGELSKAMMRFSPITPGQQVKAVEVEGFVLTENARHHESAFWRSGQRSGGFHIDVAASHGRCSRGTSRSGAKGDES